MACRIEWPHNVLLVQLSDLEVPELYHIIVVCEECLGTQTILSQIYFWLPECCQVGESCETATGMEHTALHHHSPFRQVFYLCSQQAAELLCYCHVHSIETTASVQHLQVSEGYSVTTGRSCIFNPIPSFKKKFKPVEEKICYGRDLLAISKKWNSVNLLSQVSLSVASQLASA